ncbi:MAG: hypothetical protein P9M14_04575 [Candidatus Alcyoniella australis]|nr:hypothetical protein [Candidatus Alcyoniella australis]
MNPLGLTALGLRALAAGFGRNARPFKLTLAPTMRCPYSCTFCHGDNPPQCDEAPAEAFAELFARNRFVNWIDLTGGEIFARNDLPSILHAIRSELPHLAVLHFPTSGGADLDLVRSTVHEHRLRSRGRLVVTVSVNGPAALDSQLRNSPDSFERSVLTYLTLSEIPGVDVYFGMTLVPQNIDQVQATFGALSDRVPGLEPRDLHVNFFNRSSHFFGNINCPGLTSEQTKQAATKLLELRRREPLRSPLDLLERWFLRLMPLHLRTGRSPARCVSLRSNLYIAPDLTVYPCTLWNRPLGKLEDYGFEIERLLNSDDARQARQMVEHDRCPGCWTPCEAFPSLLNWRWPATLLRRSLRDKR